MSERQTQAKCIIDRIDLVCDDCGQNMKVKGLITTYKPPWWKFWQQPINEYEYQCPQCGKQSHAGTYYPILRIIEENGKDN